MAVKFSLKKGVVPSINIVADLAMTTESNYKNCVIIITISDGDIYNVNISPSTPTAKKEEAK